MRSGTGEKLPEFRPAVLPMNAPELKESREGIEPVDVSEVPAMPRVDIEEVLDAPEDGTSREVALS